jgi:hypothetical protein
MQRLERPEAIGWRLDRNPRFRRNLLLVFHLDRTPDPRHLEASLRRAGATCEPLLSVLQSYPCDVLPPKWVARDRIESRGRPTALPASSDTTSAARLQQFAPLLLQAFDPEEPLWNLWEIANLEGGGATVLLKIHPLVAGNLDWLSLLLEGDRKPEPALNPSRIAPPEEHWLTDLSQATLAEIGQHASRLRARLKNAPAFARAPRQSLEEFFESVRGAASLWGTGQRLPDTRPAQAPFLASLHLPWADVQECARVTRSTTREVIMAGIAQAVGMFHPAPVSCSLEDSEFPWVAQQVSLKATTPDPRRRIRELQHRIRPADAETGRAFLPEMAEVLDRLPQPLLEAAADECFASSDFRCDLQPGLPTPAFFAGARVRSLNSFQTTRGHRVVASLIRSLDDLSVGLTIDSSAFPEPEALVEEIRRELENLMRLAG